MRRQWPRPEVSVFLVQVIFGFMELKKKGELKPNAVFLFLKKRNSKARVLLNFTPFPKVKNIIWMLVIVLFSLVP